MDIKIDEGSSALKQFAVTKSGLRFFANDEVPHVIREEGIIDVPFSALKAVLRDDSTTWLSGGS